MPSIAGSALDPLGPEQSTFGPSRERLGIIGFGPIGKRLAARFAKTTEGPQLAVLLVRERQKEMASASHPDAVICTDIEAFIKASPDVVVECASPDTFQQEAPALLAAGCDLIPLSLGAFADVATEKRLVEAATKGPGRMEIPAGALGSIGFLAAARENRLDKVTVTVGYPIERWLSMGADRFADLRNFRAASAFMQASARDVALRFPGHLNVVTAAALAGLGLDATDVVLVADPSAQQAWFRIDALSASGPVSLHVGGRDAAVDEDPIDYTTFSVIRLLQRRSARIAI